MENNKKISNGVKKIGTYLLYGGALFFAATLVYMSASPNKKTESSNSNAGNNPQKAEIQETKPAEKIQVYLFHSTNRCYSCVTIGQFAKKTIDQKFPEELKSGKIDFREINIDLPENKELATKFKATGSSLFINPIIDGKDNIHQDMQVWRLTSNEQAFISYLSDELKKLI